MYLPLALSFILSILSKAQLLPPGRLPPELLPPELLPPEIEALRIRYPKSQWIDPGDTVLKSYTQELPIISARGLQPELTYLLLFYDLDVIYGETATVALHWYQPNMTAHIILQTKSKLSSSTSDEDDDGDLILANRTSGAEYIAPRPPPQSHHRYVYLLFRQKDDYQFPECFSHIFPPTTEARAGFDVHQFIQVAKLDAPVAGNYFYVEFDGPPPLKTTPIAKPITTSLRSAPCSEPTTTAATGAGAATAACEYGGRAQVVL